MMKLKTQPAHVFAQYLKVPERFADFVNLVLFDGQPVIDYHHLYSYDSDSSIVLCHKDIIESIGKRRDNIMMAQIDNKPFLIAIEHQQRIDYSMCKRILTYDDNSYNQQYYLCDRSSREYLHPIPVITIVIYTGERYWIKPKSFTDRMEIPECIKDKINDWDGHIMDIKDMNSDCLRCEDNRRMVSAVQKLYKWNKDIKSIADIILTKEIAIVVSTTIIREEKLIGYIEEKDEEEINMCTAIREFREEGKIEGRVEGMLTTLKIILNSQLGNLSEEVKVQLDQSNENQLIEIMRNLTNIHSEEDILRII